MQVTKDPVGHKGARLTGQVSLPGRFLVYVPDGNTSGISRKLPDNERNRLKTLLKEIVPDTAGVIVRTAAEGASEDELTRDVERLTARWDDIEKKVAAGQAPQLLYGEPDLTLKVVRDLFTEDFTRLIIQGDDAWDLVDGYVSHVAPDLRERLERYRPDDENDGRDLFASYRVDEQIAKGLDRKVWLPSGGSLVIDRTEAMTVVDVNTGKFTGSGGNLEETVTKNNLEAAEEIVRQLRLRDIGGIIVVDFIDMVLESNRDLVLRRLVECLGRDRTRHQVAEVTSLGLVQMTRKRIGTGLLEAFSTDCEHCKGRGVLVHDHPIEPSTSSTTTPGAAAAVAAPAAGAAVAAATAATAPRPHRRRQDVAAMAREHADRHPVEELDAGIARDGRAGAAARARPGQGVRRHPRAGLSADPGGAGAAAGQRRHPAGGDRSTRPSRPAEPTEPSRRRRAGPPAEPAAGAPTVVTCTRRRRQAAPPARRSTAVPRRPRPDTDPADGQRTARRAADGSTVGTTARTTHGRRSCTCRSKRKASCERADQRKGSREALTAAPVLTVRPATA